MCSERKIDAKKEWGRGWTNQIKIGEGRETKSRNSGDPNLRPINSGKPELSARVNSYHYNGKRWSHSCKSELLICAKRKGQCMLRTPEYLDPEV